MNVLEGLSTGKRNVKKHVSFGNEHHKQCVFEALLVKENSAASGMKRSTSKIKLQLELTDGN